MKNFQKISLIVFIALFVLAPIFSVNSALAEDDDRYENEGGYWENSSNYSSRERESDDDDKYEWREKNYKGNNYQYLYEKQPTITNNPSYEVNNQEDDNYYYENTSTENRESGSENILEQIIGRLGGDSDFDGIVDAKDEYPGEDDFAYKVIDQNNNGIDDNLEFLMGRISAQPTAKPAPAVKTTPAPAPRTTVS